MRGKTNIQNIPLKSRCYSHSLDILGALILHIMPLPVFMEVSINSLAFLMHNVLNSTLYLKDCSVLGDEFRQYSREQAFCFRQEILRHNVSTQTFPVVAKNILNKNTPEVLAGGNIKTLGLCVRLVGVRINILHAQGVEKVKQMMKHCMGLMWKLMKGMAETTVAQIRVICSVLCK